MRGKLLAVSILLASFTPALAEEARWLTEEQMQSMSIDELQSWAKKADKSIRQGKVLKVDKAQTPGSRAHMEHRLGYGSMLSQNDPEVTLRGAKEPDGAGLVPGAGAGSSPYPAPKYFDDKDKMPVDHGLIGGVGKVVVSPLTGTKAVMKGTGKAMEKFFYFLDEHMPWI